MNEKLLKEIEKYEKIMGIKKNEIPIKIFGMDNESHLNSTVERKWNPMDIGKEKEKKK